MKRLLILLIASLGVASCAYRPIVCYPDAKVAKAWGCQHLGLCGPKAGLLLVGNTYVFSTDVTSSKAEWVTLDPLPREIACSGRRK